jgi:hypothetical protein
MKLIFRIALLAFTVPAFAQGQSPSDTAGDATIYVYRNFYHVTLGKEAPEIVANGETLAVLDEGRYFVAHVPPGFLIVRSGKKKDNQVDIEAKPGETYYLRVRAHPGKLFARFEMFRVSKPEAIQDAEKIKYVPASDIKSPRVIKDAPKPQ